MSDEKRRTFEDGWWAGYQDGIKPIPQHIYDKTPHGDLHAQVRVAWLVYEDHQKGDNDDDNGD